MGPYSLASGGCGQYWWHLVCRNTSHYTQMSHPVRIHFCYLLPPPVQMTLVLENGMCSTGVGWGGFVRTRRRLIYQFVLCDCAAAAAAWRCSNEEKNQDVRQISGKLRVDGSVWFPSNTSSSKTLRTRRLCVSLCGCICTFLLSSCSHHTSTSLITHT